VSETVDLDEIERVLLQRVTPDNVTSLLLLDIARSLRALVVVTDLGNLQRAWRPADGTAPSTEVG
jgi:hypothetical protein